MINLEVLRAAQTLSPVSPPKSPSIQELVDQLSDLKLSLTSQINMIRSEINIPLANCQNCKHACNFSSPSIPVEPISSSAARTTSERVLPSSASTQTAPLPPSLWFPLPPPQISCKRDVSSQAVVASKASSSISTQVSFLEKQVKASCPLKNSLLGKPPKEKRIRGQLEPLSKSFLHQHGSYRAGPSEKDKYVNKSDDKVVNERSETSTRIKRKKTTKKPQPSKKPPVLPSGVLLVDLSAPLPTADVTTHVDEPLIDFEVYLSAPDISDDYGDPTPTLSPDQMYDLPTPSFSEARDPPSTSEIHLN